MINFIVCASALLLNAVHGIQLEREVAFRHGTRHSLLTKSGNGAANKEITLLGTQEKCGEDGGPFCLVVQWVRSAESCNSMLVPFEERDQEGLPKNDLRRKYSANPPLDEVGRKQAADLKQYYFPLNKPDMVITSTAIRAIETAVLASPDGTSIQPRENLNEIQASNVSAKAFDNGDAPFDAETTKTLVCTAETKGEEKCKAKDNDTIEIDFSKFGAETGKPGYKPNGSFEAFKTELMEDVKDKVEKANFRVAVFTHQHFIKAEVMLSMGVNVMEDEDPTIANAEVNQAVYTLNAEKNNLLKVTQDNARGNGSGLNAQFPGFIRKAASPLQHRDNCSVTCQRWWSLQKMPQSQIAYYTEGACAAQRRTIN